MVHARLELMDVRRLVVGVHAHIHLGVGLRSPRLRRHIQLGRPRLQK